MAKDLSIQKTSTNRFLADIERWEETEVSDYKRKVAFELSEAWTEAVIIFALMLTVLGYVWAFIATSLPDSMSPAGKGCVAVALYMVITIIVAAVAAKKNLKKFVESNRGEVGHKGEPYYKKVTAMIPLSFIVGIIINTVIWMVVVKDFGNFTTDKLGVVQPISCAALYPFFYYSATLSELIKLQKRVCPVCGRFDSVVTENIARYGKKREGVNHITRTQTKKVGEERTIARYADGHTQIVSSKPIYANVVVDEYDVEYGTVMSDYLTYCRHCSYVEEGTKEHSYSTRIN